MYGIKVVSIIFIPLLKTEAQRYVRRNVVDVVDRLRPQGLDDPEAPCSWLDDKLDVDVGGTAMSTTSAVPRRFLTRMVEADYDHYPDPAELQK